MAQQPVKLEIKQLSSFVSPFLMNNRPVSCVVGENGTTIHYKESGRKTDYELVEPRTQGTEITLDVSRYSIDATLTSDELQYKAELQREREASIERQRQQDEQRRIQKERDAFEFNQSLNIPFRWAPDIKVVLSGLSANSAGNGINRRSVSHIRVLEPYQDGRFVRTRGDFLCGKDNSKYQGYSAPDESKKHTVKVTCKQCIKAAERFNKI
ncbi:putative Predicted protein [Vibrio nigripulchritudo SOn1]|uniref:Uncharacterized protein n=1 Tax=Vibrio nigripulchritudo SOn1 TaxID=1238450 RepID=A0AAV2VHS3_9VIBR|nr:hypothetical protein [Vibrio nigripulchritudo]CCO44202.1 putative Predicted protein [Vibrio nigripulchritudo SOn1]